MMSLVADYTDSSSSGNSTDTDIEDDKSVSQKPPTEIVEQPQKLPSASQLLSNETKATRKVLSNPYLEAELAKTSALEKHVKMVTNDDYLLEKNGRKICWSYRKGRCRFGTSCQYAHDSDLNVQIVNKTEVNTQKDADLKIETTFKKKATKRSRPGLSDTIEPSKRTMKFYMEHSRKN